MLILECSQGKNYTLWPWPLTLKIKGFQILLRTKYIVCTKFGQNPLKDVDSSMSRVFTRMICGKKIDPVTLTFDIWPWKLIGFQILLRTKYVPSLVKILRRMLILECSQGCYAVKKNGPKNGDDLWHMTLKINRVPDSLKD
jgi:hypothetical protein